MMVALCFPCDQQLFQAAWLWVAGVAHSWSSQLAGTLCHSPDPAEENHFLKFILICINMIIHFKKGAESNFTGMLHGIYSFFFFEGGGTLQF